MTKRDIFAFKELLFKIPHGRQVNAKGQANHLAAADLIRLLASRPIERISPIRSALMESKADGSVLAFEMVSMTKSAKKFAKAFNWQRLARERLSRMVELRSTHFGSQSAC